MKPSLHARYLLAELGSLTTSCFASISAWQEQVDWLFRILASLVAVGAGIVSIYFALKRHRTPKE